MSNLFSNLSECLGFSQIIKSISRKMFFALKLISSRLPIGVEIIYKPFSKLFILFLLTIIISCVPQNNPKKENVSIINNSQVLKKADISEEKTIQDIEKNNFQQSQVLNEFEIILPEFDNQNITKYFINAFELSLYKKGIKNIQLNINLYENKKELNKIIAQKSLPGKIFIGPLTSTDTEGLINKCSQGILFFSFASNRKYAEECIYLINFFPEDDLITLFNNFAVNSKIALLYPENDYGYYINSIIDPIAMKSDSLIINRASYKEDLSNAREAI